MYNTCDDNRFQLIEKYKAKLIESTNIADDPEDMAAIDSILFRFWQMDWLDKLEEPSAQRWIPCSKRLPEVGQIVLICRDNRLVREATYKGINSQEETVWICHGNVLWDDDVLRWMPMPEPYKGERK